MSSILRVVASAVLCLHGLVHLLGTAVYFRLAEVPEFPYKTTLLGGRWDLGAAGIRVFGLLWAGTAIGFGIAAVAVCGTGQPGREFWLPSRSFPWR